MEQWIKTEMKKNRGAKTSATSFPGLDVVEFSSCLFKGGITWLTRLQMQWLFEYLDDNRDGFVSFPEWTARFHFDLLEAAQEVQRVLASGMKSGGVFAVPEEMDLEAFVLTLHGCKVGWLCL